MISSVRRRAPFTKGAVIDRDGAPRRTVEIIQAYGVSTPGPDVTATTTRPTFPLLPVTRIVFMQVLCSGKTIRRMLLSRGFIADRLTCCYLWLRWTC